MAEGLDVVARRKVRGAELLILAGKVNRRIRFDGITNFLHVHYMDKTFPVFKTVPFVLQEL